MALTIPDVPREVKVRTATLPHGLNNTGQVNRETPRQALTVVRRHGYFLNAYARNSACRDSRTLSMIVSDLEPPFFRKS